MKRLVCAFVLFMAGATAEAAETFLGSGVVINSKGEILTNSHVVEACVEISARLPFDGNIEAPAILVARDERNDLAVIRVTRPNISAPQLPHSARVLLFALASP
jgi:S1-C subfamily serine protease